MVHLPYRHDELVDYYAAIVESSEDAIIGKSLDGIIQSWNHGAERIFGYSAEEAVGRSILMLFPPERVEEEAAILRRIGSGEHIEHYETVRVTKDGGQIQVSVTISPVKDPDGKIIGVSKIARDMTRLKKTEKELRDAQGRYKETLDHLLEGCQIIDFEWRYVYLNDVAAIHGRKRKEELIGRTMMEVYPGIDKTEMFDILKNCMEKRVPQRIQNLFMYDGGGEAWFNLNIDPVPEGVFILSVDITEEKKMLEELKIYREHLEGLVKERTSQLEEANRELESFSYSVSHDLRAPLRHINGFVKLLQRHATTLDNESKRYLEVVSSSTAEMGTLIDSLLDFSRMGRTELTKHRTDVDSLVSRVISELSPPGGEQKVKWDIGRLPAVEADPNLLRLVFMNLISNAVKYSRGRELPEIAIRHSRKKNEDIFMVKDNGVGFDMNYKDRLFGVFQRLHGQDQFEGIGIGLANVRRIILRHGGRVWAEGEVGKGAAFYFSLPVAVGEET